MLLDPFRCVCQFAIASACGVITTLDPSRVEYRQTLDELNHFCREQTLPADLRVRLREYFRHQAPIFRYQRQAHLLDMMSVRLRGDATYHMCEHKLRHVPYLTHPDAEPELLCHLTLLFTMRVFSSLERVPCTDLFVVERGLIARHGKLAMAGQCFGIDNFFRVVLCPDPDTMKEVCSRIDEFCKKHQK